MNLDPPPLGADATDAQLVALSLAGDREAFAQIVARHQSLVCALAYSGLGNLAQSEDLAQETFIAAWQHLPDLREPAKLKPWLCEIARNRIHRWRSNQQRDPTHAAATMESVERIADQQPSPSAVAVRREEENILWREMEQIPEIYRESLILFYRQNQSVENVAAALDVSEEVVRQRLSRGRKMLQEQVLALVEGTLARTNPGTTFTAGVMLALPKLATSGKVATMAASAAKGATAAKASGILGWFGVLMWPIIWALGIGWLGNEMGSQAAQKQRDEKAAKSPWKMLVTLGVFFVMIYCWVVYWQTHPVLISVSIFGWVLVSQLAKMWHAPDKSNFTPIFISQTILKGVGREVLEIGLCWAFYYLMLYSWASALAFLAVVYPGLILAKAKNWGSLAQRRSAAAKLVVFAFIILDTLQKHILGSASPAHSFLALMISLLLFMPFRTKRASRPRARRSMNLSRADAAQTGPGGPSNTAPAISSPNTAVNSIGNGFFESGLGVAGIKERGLQVLPMTRRRLWFVLLCFLPVVLVFLFAIYASGKPVDKPELLFLLSFLGLFFLFLVFATYPPLASKINSALIRWVKWDTAELKRLNPGSRSALWGSALMLALLLYLFTELNLFQTFMIFCAARVIGLVIIVGVRNARKR